MPQRQESGRSAKSKILNDFDCTNVDAIRLVTLVTIGQRTYLQGQCRKLLQERFKRLLRLFKIEKKHSVRAETLGACILLNTCNRRQRDTVSSLVWQHNLMTNGHVPIPRGVTKMYARPKRKYFILLNLASMKVHPMLMPSIPCTVQHHMMRAEFLQSCGMVVFSR